MDQKLCVYPFPTREETNFTSSAYKGGMVEMLGDFEQKGSDVNCLVLIPVPPLTGCVTWLSYLASHASTSSSVMGLIAVPT